MKTIRSTANEYEILLTHPNGEQKWLPIEAWAERWITIRWEMAGQYDIMLKNGNIISRLAASRRKFAQVPNPWTVNLDECRQFIAERYGRTKEEIDESFRDHHERMPYARPGVRRSAPIGQTRFTVKRGK